MPIQEFRCPQCRQTHDRIVKMSEADKEERCALCDSVCERVYSKQGSTFKLNGRGWSDDGYTGGLKDYDPAGGKY